MTGFAAPSNPSLNADTGAAKAPLVGAALAEARTPVAAAAVPEASRSRGGRIVAVDALRFLCMVEILGFHWLRACYKSGFFHNAAAPESAGSIVWSYRNVTDGWNTTNWLLLDSGHGLPAFLNNLLGLMFGFGWQAVSLFLFLSGLSLALSRPDTPRSDGTWMNWFRRRVITLLGPYYLVALPVVALLLVLPPLLGPLAQHLGPAITEKLALYRAPNPLSVLFSHLLLFDPTRKLGVASFFVPAWWFLPSILLAYAAYPWCLRILSRVGEGWFLAGAVALQVFGQILLSQQVLDSNAWYRSLLLAPFAFALGVVVGRRLAGKDGSSFKPRPEWVAGAMGGGVLLLAVATVTNWFPATHILSSFLRVLAAAVTGAVIAHFAVGIKGFSRFLKVDTYHVYLLHQPLALPVTLVAGKLFGAYATPLGMVLYAVITLTVVKVFGRVYLWIARRLGLEARRAPAAPVA